MDISLILDDLNDAQRQAVSASPGPLRVLAGAGSGKTRVLTRRIAWLLTVERASPWSILAVTFTNKAAAEMRGRVEQLLGSTMGGLWIGTFHSIAHRLLRMHWQEAKLPRTFQVLDADDQQRLVKRVIRTLALDEKKWPPQQATGFINSRKDQGLRAHQIDDGNDPVLRQWLRIYQAYQEQCERAALVDFGELLLRVYELWRDTPELVQHYRQRFQHVLVDEFQDTNTIQYQSLRLLTGGQGDVCIVGDDDQSVYSWRGARVENMFQFERDFVGTNTVRLEQNYRSTGTILTAANQLIAQNTGRLGKKLWTEDGEGEPIALYTAFNDIEEARFVIDRIRRWEDQGGKRSEVAILYRSNAQSRQFEENLIGARIPYRVYGGLRFFERAEIKDALAYLRLIANRDDDASFERVNNTPTRGIGGRSLDVLRDVAKRLQLPLWRAAQRVVSEQLLPSRALNALHGFLLLIDNLDRDTMGLTLPEQVDHVVVHSGLLEMYRQAKDNKSETRVENLEELVNAAGVDLEPIVLDDGAEPLSPLTTFLTHAALEAGEGQAAAWEDCVQLMTLHSAKGLEFPVVFLVGLEEGLFPHQQSLQEPGRLEEERRLAYVGITRAQKQLTLSYAEKRRLYGKEIYPTPSRFLTEIPAELIKDVRTHSKARLPAFNRPAPAQESGDTLRPGQRVRHPNFGSGVVQSVEGEGSRTRVQVRFGMAGSKWLVLAYANLEPM
ncbi:MAG: DNA helicase II [Candidatus Competibacteraceae bacterium]|jgi:DNA helicase-2/ATP-dependent DNA helicase PcrA|nr:DNA helicase II [Candidatus Competibacteraceae bacterium]